MTMNERYLFRAWNGNKMIYFGKGEITTNYDNKFGIFMPMLSDTFNMSDGFDIRQCTGLRDKYGVLIYDGDVVIRGNQPFTVKWEDKNARSMCISEFSWNANRGEYTKGQGNTLCYLSDSLKIIGNIHDDNPELLEVR